MNSSRSSQKLALVLGGMLSTILLLSCSGDDESSRLGPDTLGTGGEAGSTGTEGSSGTAGTAAHAAGTSGDTGGGNTGGSSGVAGSSAGAGGSGGSAGPAVDCTKDRPGPPMVAVTSPTGVISCIDKTEVTLGQYREFVAQQGGKEGEQDTEECKTHNSSFVPDQTRDDGGPPRPCESTYLTDDAASPEHPMGCVDSCDARAYCTWAGKQLCGLKRDGTVIPVSGLKDPAQSVWFNACSQGGTQTFAYGDQAKPQECPWITGPSSDVVSSTGDECGSVGPATEEPVLDMTSGLGEVELAMREDGLVATMYRGFHETTIAGANGRCAFTGEGSAGELAQNIGFRCCLE